MSLKELTIVTVTYNSAGVLPRLLAGLQGLDVLVVDNGSSDDTRAVAARFSGVRVIESGNVGYGRGANLGFREAKTPYVMLVNPDVEIGSDAILQMLACMQARPDLGMLGANLTGTKGEGVREVEWIVGALMMMRMDALAKVGLFDENIFLFYEETDLCRRFVKAGYKLGILESILAKHEAGTSSPPSLRVLKIKAWHSAWSKAYYYHKHFSRAACAKKCISKIATALLRIIRGILAADWRWVIKNYYEMLGVISYSLGFSAFKNGVGRFT